MDASGSGNDGTAAHTTWTATGKYGGALSFNGTSSRVTIPGSASLQLTRAMTLEAWVNPTTVSNAWRDVIMKGNDNYYLSATSIAESWASQVRSDQARSRAHRVDHDRRWAPEPPKLEPPAGPEDTRQPLARTANRSRDSPRSGSQPER